MKMKKVSKKFLISLAVLIALALFFLVLPLFAETVPHHWQFVSILKMHLSLLLTVAFRVFIPKTPFLPSKVRQKQASGALNVTFTQPKTENGW